MNIEQLAEELHKFYRAAFKALRPRVIRIPDEGYLAISSHDHGWDHCNKKDYFRRRAEMLREAGVPVIPTFTGVLIEEIYDGC